MPKVQVNEYDICQHGEECNTQSIKEALLREAVKECDYYASDILIFLGGRIWQSLVLGDIKSVQLIFKSAGVDWVENTTYDKEFMKHTNIRSIATITVEPVLEFKQRNMKLIIEAGNC